jgi:hypothetical protein
VSPPGAAQRRERRRQHVKLTATILNFVGAGVTATHSGGTVTATIPGGTSTAEIIVQEEGSTVGTATHLNFVGSSITATFSNGTATVTDAGASSSVYYGHTKPSSPDDDFSSGTVLSASWAAQSYQGSFSTADAYVRGVDGSHLVIDYDNQMGYLYLSATDAANQTWQAGGIFAHGNIHSATQAMYGIALLSAGGTGVGITVYNDSNVYLATIENGNYVTQFGGITGLGHSAGLPNHIYAMKLERSNGTVWTASISITGRAWDYSVAGTAAGSVTIARACIGLFFNTATTTYKGRLTYDYVDKA